MLQLNKGEKMKERVIPGARAEATSGQSVPSTSLGPHTPRPASHHPVTHHPHSPCTSFDEPIKQGHTPKAVRLDMCTHARRCVCNYPTLPCRCRK